MCCCLEFIPPFFNLLFPHFSNSSSGTTSMASIISVPSPTEDAENIRTAVQGWGTDEAALIEILARRTAAERVEIGVAYEGLYGEPLVGRLQSELSGHFRDAVVLLTTEPAARDAELAYKALRRKGGGERQAWVLIEVACASTPEHLVAVRKAYCSAHDASLEEHVAASSLYEEPLKQLLVRLVSSYRYDGQHVDDELARAEAAELHGAAVAKKHDDDVVVRLVSSRSKPQLMATFQHYKQQHGMAIDEVLEENRNDQLSAMLKTAIWCLTSPEKHFAELIRSSIVGLGTDEESLTRAVVSRAEIDMEKVKQEYTARYTTTVTADVGGDSSGYYRDILLALVGAE